MGSTNFQGTLKKGFILSDVLGHMVEPDQLAPLDYCEKGFLVCYVLSKKLLVLYSLYEIVCHFFSNIWILLVRSLVTILVGPQEPLLANDKLV